MQSLHIGQRSTDGGTLPTPPLPLNTHLDPPRFLVPFSKKERDEKRPLVRYTQVLNRLSDEEWKDLDLPHPSSISPRQNVQLPDIAGRAYDLVTVGVDDSEVASGN